MIMGVNYGKRRGRLEILGGIPKTVVYALGNKHLKYSHADEDEFYDEINRVLDRTSERFRSRA